MPEDVFQRGCASPGRYSSPSVPPEDLEISEPMRIIVSWILL
jgi:hypothetical protein